MFTVQQSAGLRVETTRFNPSCLGLCSAWHIVTAGLCYRAAPQPCGNIFFVGCGGGFTWGLILWWRKGARETTASHAADGDRIHWNKICMWTWRVDSWLTPCCSQKTAGGCFCCPTLSVQDETVQSDVITTAYANQLCDRMAGLGFKEIVLACRCTVHVCRVKNSPPSYNFISNKKNLKTRIFVEKSLFLFNKSNLNTASKMEKSHIGMSETKLFKLHREKRTRTYFLLFQFDSKNIRGGTQRSQKWSIRCSCPTGLAFECLCDRIVICKFAPELQFVARDNSLGCRMDTTAGVNTNNNKTTPPPPPKKISHYTYCSIEYW